MVDGEEEDDVEEFTYLGAIVDKKGGGSKDIMHRLQKALGAFQGLRRVWAAGEIGRKTKIRLSRLEFDRPCYMAKKLGRSPRTMNGS